MNNYQRGIIAYHYKEYLQNRCNGDPVGGFEDIRYMFKSLAESDPKLKEVMDDIFDRFDND